MVGLSRWSVPDFVSGGGSTSPRWGAYIESRTCDPQMLIAADVARSLHIDLLRDVDAKSMVGALEDAFERNLPPNGLLEVKGGEAVSDIQAIKANSEGGRQGRSGKLDHYRLKLRNSRPRRQIFREADQIGAEPPARSAPDATSSAS